MCVTIKDFILKYDYNFRNILEYSIYDTNTVNILSTMTENTKQTKKGIHGTRQRRNILKLIILASTRLMIATVQWEGFTWLTSSAYIIG